MTHQITLHLTRGKILASWTCLILTLAILAPTPSPGADTAVLAGPGQPIPAKYRTWTLFLINSDWALDQSNEKLAALYKRFNSFGDAIGPDNVAVWFWSKDPDFNELHKSLDALRSAALLRSLKLKPSEGPYLLVTTKYPGACTTDKFPSSFPASTKDFLVLKLNGTDAAATASLLRELGDALVTEELSKLQPKSETYWTVWRKGFDSLSGTVLGLTSNLTVSVDTGLVKTEWKPGH